MLGSGTGRKPMLCHLLVLRERPAYLLINRICRVVHENRAFLVVELAIHSRVSDQVHDPLLAFVLIET